MGHATHIAPYLKYLQRPFDLKHCKPATTPRSPGKPTGNTNVQPNHEHCQTSQESVGTVEYFGSSRRDMQVEKSYDWSVDKTQEMPERHRRSSMERETNEQTIFQRQPSGAQREVRLGRTKNE